MTLDKGESFGIHEVYYNKNGKPKMYSENHMCPHGETLDELRSDIEFMLKAFEKTILTPEDFKKEK